MCSEEIYNMELNNSQFKQLDNFYNLHSCSNAVFLTGKKGIGKSTVVRNFLKDKENVLHISVLGKYSYMLEPLVLAINNYYVSKCSKYIFEHQNGLHMTDRIIYEIIEICKKNEMILYFENLKEYSEELFECIIKLLDIFVNQNKGLNSFFIFEIDTDGDNGFNINNTITSLYEISSDFDFIPFFSLKQEELTTYFIEKFSDKIQIQKKDLEYIIESCSGNLSCLNMIINYLKQISIIIYKENHYICTDIPPGSLSDVLYSSIMSRYNLLNNEMKQLLEQSSLIGIDFNSQKLQDSFHILQADEELSRIESISALIYENGNYTYHFENYETYNIILNKIDPAERHNWNNLLAIYYEKQLTFAENTEKQLDILYKLAFHYRGSMHFEKAMYYYILLIRSTIKLLDYKQALAFIDEAIALSVYTDEQTKKFAMPLLIAYKGKCNIFLGRYDVAVALYQQCISEYGSTFSQLEILSLRLDFSYSTYMNGDLPNALQNTLSIMDELNRNTSEKKLLYRTMSFLASIYHLLGEDTKAEDYFIKAITYCKEYGFEDEYYMQLKKSSMIFDIELAQPLLREATIYFETKNKISCLAETLHNLSTDNLYLLKLESFETDCQKSIHIFQQYGSLLVHYPLNTLGIYKAIIKNDLDSAIEIFERILKFDVESFSKVSIYTNLITCYRCKKDFKKCSFLIKQADLLIEQAENQDIILLQTYHYINNALYFKSQGELNKALFIFQQCLDQLNVQDRHKAYICNIMKKIYLTQKRTVPPMIEKNCNISTHPLISLLQKKDMFFATMRFYE